MCYFLFKFITKLIDYRGALEKNKTKIKQDGKMVTINLSAEMYSF